MPKEQFNYEQHEPGTISPEFSLHWSSDPITGHIQLSVTVNAAATREYLAELAKDSPSDKTAIFYSEPLNRPDLQRLIRAARRARDHIFGADE